MTKPIIPKVNDEFESLEAFKDAAKSAAKYRGFAFSRKDSNLTRCNGKSPFVVLQCMKGAAVNKSMDSEMIFSKNIINKRARIRLALNEEVAKYAAKCPEVLIVDSTYQTNIYKYPLISAVGINNISNKRGALASYQIAIAWIEDEKKEEEILQSLNTIKKAAKKAHSPEKIELYIQTWMKDLKM
ncbi:768_t:CDS:2 [Dentiscutata erythropus]|uniref:768_t:CDS:1 n=1 Tax=Dentiscutata erythropus TaxID=1348616 RepID=A0A9N9HAJ2_9GLOM|nr:768_t:CDS:2 [Dentiscutata erythropus]